MKFSPSTQRLLSVGALLVWSVALVIARLILSPDHLGYGMLWNLLLASIPLLGSSIFVRAVARKHWVWASVSFALWLLFLPNAPYLLTDMIHLAPRPPVPQWYILAMLLSCAATGTLLGYLSLLDVHALIEKRCGKITGWMVAVGALMLCGFGIYLGRFLRWNSWDALTHPLQFIRVTVGQFHNTNGHPHPVAVTLVFGAGLVLGYLVLRVISAPGASD